MGKKSDTIPTCPILSIGTGEIDMICSQTKCAWYIPNVQKCAVYLMAYNSLLDINSKTRPPKK